MDKHPIGITPRFIWEEKRLKDIVEAMDRYEEAGIDFPFEWLAEYKELSEKFIKRNRRS